MQNIAKKILHPPITVINHKKNTEYKSISTLDFLPPIEIECPLKIKSIYNSSAVDHNIPPIIVS